MVEDIPVSPNDDLPSYSLKELREIAEALGIETAKMSKIDLILAIRGK